MTITLFIDNRHVKDILRSYCHEMIHHIQNISDENFKNMNMNGSLVENKELEDVEGDAYRRGNIMFRKWTEQFRK